MIKDIKVQNENVQPSDRVMAKLHADFPQCFTNEGKFDLEKFKSLLNDKIDITEEGYDLNFLGKNYANLIASTETETVIQPDIEHNSKPENKDSQNIYISGDNLDALKHLLKSYAGKIKCIYIDPPYNTGNDGFVYNDKFNFTVEQLQTKLGIGEEKAKRILDLCKRGSASHSAWLMFMAPRLMLARDLLTEDGVIFISIDDNEQANLKLLCDSVFGEENFESSITIVVNPGGRDYKQVALTNEYLILYSQDESEINEIPKDEPFTHSDSKGGFNYRELRNRNPKFNSSNRPNLFYPFFVNPKIIDEEGYCCVNLEQTEEYYVEVKPHNSVGDESVWRWGKEKSIGNIVLGNLDCSQILAKQKKDGGWNIYEKNRKSTSKVKSLWGTKDDLSMRTEDGTREVRNLLGKALFDHPKPVELIKRVLQISVSNNDIVLDFFSGSATTAEALIKNNTENGLNNRFILVQIPIDEDNEYKLSKSDKRKKIEEILDFLDENDHPHTLDYIGFERICRASAKIKSDLQEEIKQKESQLKTKEEKLAKESQQVKIFEEENPLTQEIETLKGEIETKKETLQNLDWGFKHFTLQDVPQDTLDKMETFDPSMSNAFADPDVLQSFGAETVLATWMVKDGYGLTQNAELLQLADYTAYHCGGHIYMIEGESFDEKAMIALVDKYGQEADFNPHNVVLFGYSFTFTQTEMLKKNLSAVKKLNESINIDIRY